MKVKANVNALRPLTAKARSSSDTAPAAPQFLDLVRSGKLSKRSMRQFLRQTNFKKAGAVAGGAVLLLSALSLAGRYQLYRGAVVGELRRQLEPIRKKLDALEAETRALRELLVQNGPSPEKTAPET